MMMTVLSTTIHFLGPAAAKPSGGAGQDKEGGDKSGASNAEIMSARDEVNAKRPYQSPPGSPGGSGPSDGGGGRGGPQGPGGPRDPGGIDESTPLDQWRQVGNNHKIDLLDIPDVANIREWQMHAIRAIA
eukprot:8733564-Pyramimonas_sp.AAC.1